MRNRRSKNYGPDVLATNWRRPHRVPEIPIERDMVVEDASGEFCGAVVSWEKDTVTLEDRFRRRRVFPLAPAGFLFEGRLVTLVRPKSVTSLSMTPGRTASGSIAVSGVPAQVARQSRIYVEGVHDAELVERVWGDDLRVEGVVVEYLEGVDQLPEVVRAFQPGPSRRLGVLLDHMISGSKETRIADSVRSPHVLVTGHPFVDIWQAIKPTTVCITRWPEVPKGVPWKSGVCAALGWPDDTGAAWRGILGSVRSYLDLEPALLGRVEELIDFVTVET